MLNPYADAGRYLLWGAVLLVACGVGIDRGAQCACSYVGAHLRWEAAE